ncbi:PAS domain S-box protein [Flavobacterium zepuense]|uniref:histidine kinase n=1 Tax=Flavobacterium zepuense TaxID=2593302 RepID=A0A552UZP5_9FLAO|nr:PAS domain-containing protein [Flavobacterium zepuense]TRW23681.1 PAS domain S-box protein [Flavobacterium zepuense]
MSSTPQEFLLLNAMPQMVWTNLPDGKVSLYNKKWEEYTGLKMATGVEWITPETVHPEDLQNLVKKFQHALKENIPFEAEARYKRADGQYRWHLNRSCPLTNDEGKIYSWIGTATDIKDQKNAEQGLVKKTLEETNTHLDLLRNTVPAMIFYLDKEQRYKSYNNAFMEWFEVDATTALGITVREFLGEAHYVKAFPYLEKAYNGEQQIYEVFAPTRMRGGKWLNVVYTPHIDNQGNIIGVIVHSTDVTQSKQTEISLRESEARFRALVEEAPVATCLFTGKEMTIEIANDMMLGVWGKDASVIGRKLEDAVPELKGQPFLDILDQVYTTGIAYTKTAAAADLEVDGVLSTYYFNFTYKPLFDQNGEVYGIMDMAVDVTEQVIVRKKIEESERKLRTLIQSAPPAIGMFVGKDLIIESPNQMFKDTIGRGNEIEGKSLRTLMPELEQQPFLGLLDDVFTTGKMFQVDGAKLQVLKDDKLEEKYFNVTFSPLFDESGNVYAIIDVSVDVTDAVLAKKNIEEKEKELREVITAAPVGICVVSSLHLNIEEVNDRFLTIIGAERIEQSKIISVFRSELESVFGSGTKHTAEEREMIILRNDLKESMYVTFEFIPFLNENETVIKVMVVAIEMTQQVQMRKEIEKAVAERTKELDTLNINLQRSNYELEQFAYIASHDLQEPVRKINTFLGMLENSLENINDKSINYLEKIKNSTQRMEALIRDVLAFSTLSPNSILLSNVNLQDILNEVSSQNEVLISNKHAVVEYSNLPIIKAIPSQMLQLLNNLMSNALKYSKDGVSPEIRVGATKLNDKEIKNLPQLSPQKKYLKIEFTDNGIGFDEQHADRIFKIFQRLHGKNEFEGTGIGLAICQKIVHNHGGEIIARPRPEGGAIFTIILPD